MAKYVNIKKIKTYSIYTILFSIISLIIFVVFIKANKSFIWAHDGFKQHFVILYDFNQMIRNIFQNGFPTFSWDMGLGLDVIGQYSYYVIGDPFAFVSLLFPMKYLDTVYSMLVILRMYCVGLAFIVYSKYHKKNTVNTIIGAIIYTFCGFVLYAGIRHPYFTNALIFLPLNLMAIDKLLKENKKSFLIFMVFITAICNYYFFYMITVITGIYAIIKYIFEYNEGVHVFIKKVGIAICCYIVGLLMASVVLLPTLYDFLNSARTSYEQSYVYSSRYYTSLFMGIISMKSKNWTFISISSIILLMLPVLFTKLKEKESKTYLTLFTITTVMLLIPFISSIMNGLSFPNNRWVFSYSFILAYIVTICFEEKLKYSKRQLIFMGVGLAIYCLIGVIIVGNRIEPNLGFLSSMAIAIIMYIFILFSNTRKNIIVNCGIISLIIVNIWINSLSLYAERGYGYVKQFVDNNKVYERYSTVNGKIQNFEEAVNYIKENDNGFYRISKCDKSNQNMSMIYDYKPIQTFLSIGNGYVYEMSKSLNDNDYATTRCIEGMDRRTKITTLLGTKYFICDKKDINYVPYGYKKYKEIGETMIYINEYNVSPGVFYDSYMLEEKYDKLEPLDREDEFISTAVLDKDISDVEKREVLDNSVTELKYKVKDNKIEDNKINITKDYQSIYLEIEDIQPDREIYLNIKNLKFDDEKSDFKVKATLNDVTGYEDVQNYITSAYYMENPDFLINLGISKKNMKKELKITFNKKGVYSFESLKLLSVSMDEYKHKIEKLQENDMTNVKYGSNYINGEIEAKTNGILQISTSYSKGWNIYVDGEKQEVLKVNKGLIGVKLQEGKHEIRAEYTTPYIKIAMFLSLIGFIIFVIVIKLEKN